ncbi:MAG: hypothetical protein AAFR17_09755 [Pseudomonadota bacterium]
MPRMSSATRAAGLIVVALILAACAKATPYQPAAKRFGFAEQRIEDNRYLVSFRGNSATPRNVVETYLLYRAAEVTRETGFDWFRIAEQETGPDLQQQSLFGKRAKHRHRHKRRGKFRRRSFVRFGFFHRPFFFGGVHTYRPPPPRFQASANILMFRGEKPEDDPMAYDAAAVLSNLGPRILRPESE